MLANRDQTQANQDLDCQKTGVSQEPKGKFRTGQTLEFQPLETPKSLVLSPPHKKNEG